jgi:hypothetical protein
MRQPCRLLITSYLLPGNCGRRGPGYPLAVPGQLAPTGGHTRPREACRTYPAACSHPTPLMPAPAQPRFGAGGQQRMSISGRSSGTCGCGAAPACGQLQGQVLCCAATWPGRWCTGSGVHRGRRGAAPHGASRSPTGGAGQPARLPSVLRCWHAPAAPRPVPGVRQLPSRPAGTAALRPLRLPSEGTPPAANSRRLPVATAACSCTPRPVALHSPPDRRGGWGRCGRSAAAAPHQCRQHARARHTQRTRASRPPHLTPVLTPRERARGRASLVITHCLRPTTTATLLRC